MTAPMTPADLRRPNDLLIEYDRLPRSERLERLQHRLGDFDRAYAFDVCASDWSFRASLELRWNGNVPVETLWPLQLGRILHVPSRPFRSHVPCVSGEELVAVAPLPRKVIEFMPRLRPGVGGPLELLEGAVKGYAARDAGLGVVLSRDLLEASFAVGDVELLRRAVVPLPDGGSRPLLETLSRDPFPDHDPAAADPEAVRRSAFPWWGADPDHGTTIHVVEEEEEDPAVVREMEELIERDQAEAFAPLTEEDLASLAEHGFPPPWPRAPDVD